MNPKQNFFSSVCALAIPAALQSMLQSSFSIVDQIMIGQLGSVSIAGVGLAGKFSSIYSVVISAIGAVAGIMISQYLGQKNAREVKRSFRINLLLGLVLALGFSIACLALPRQIMGLYSKDASTVEAAAKYLLLITGTFLPMAGATLMATLFRCAEKAKLPLYASIASALANTVLNYILIFGKLGLPAMGAGGAAIATVIAQWLNFLLMVLMYRPSLLPAGTASPAQRFHWRQYLAMLLPLLACEVLWSLGENVYAGIYGHMGTDATAAMTLINPVQGLFFGALCGLSQAAGVLVGKRLGAEEYEKAYQESKKLMLWGAIGAGILSCLVVLGSGLYVQIYRVSPTVKALTRQILFSFALVAPFKALNMIVGGGVLRSGGKTQYVMAIDFIGTWIFGVPVGLLSAFVWKLSIPYVYLLLSLEECVRFLLSLVMFHRRSWMRSLQSQKS